MPDFYLLEKKRWLTCSPEGRCEILNSSSQDDFQIISFSGRLRAATELEMSPTNKRLLFWLNLKGSGVFAGQPPLPFQVSQLSFGFLSDTSPLKVERHAGLHEFLLLTFTIDYLQKILGGRDEPLNQPVHAAVYGNPPPTVTEPMSLNDLAFAQALTSPPIVSAASHLWFHSKAMEFIATHCYRQPGSETSPFFCSQQKRLAQERIAKAKAYLQAHLDEPLKLDAVARSVGTSPHYLSRTFSSETGLTLSRYLRSLRITEAAKLLSTGQLNISEVAIEVGYRSQSHFARAFEIEKGCTPTGFLASRSTPRKN